MEVVKRHWIFIAEFLEVAKGGKQKVGKCTFTETWVKAVVGGMVWPGWTATRPLRHPETRHVFRKFRVFLLSDHWQSHLAPRIVM